MSKKVSLKFVRRTPTFITMPSGTNHIIGGIAIVGSTAAIFDINIFNDYYSIPFVVFFSILADIDHKKSLIGKVFFFVSENLERNFGHRTVTHSLLFWLALTLIIAIIEKLIINGLEITFICSIAYLSHLLLDMCTLSGIPFFWGFTTDRCFLALNRNMRLRAGDVKGEAGLMLLSFLLIVSMYPLMDAGLSNIYKSNFKSVEYLKGFAVSSKRSLKISFQYKDLEYKNLEFVKFSDNKIICFEPESRTFEEFENQEVQSILIDSLKDRKYLSDVSLQRVSEQDLRELLLGDVLSGDIQSNKKLSFLENGIVKTSQVIKVSNKNKEFVVIESDVIADSAAIYLEIQTIEKSKSLEAEKFRSEQNELNSLKQQLEKLSNLKGLSDFETGKNIVEKKRISQEIQKKMPSSGTPDYFLRNQRIKNLKKSLNPTNQKTYFNGNLTLWKKSKL